MVADKNKNVGVVKNHIYLPGMPEQLLLHSYALCIEEP